MATALHDGLVGRLVDGRYEVVERIANGGMATVYRALDTRLRRDVALKAMHPHLAQDPAFVARFTQEARSAARLSHPGVVAVYDQGEDDGAVYLTMELVPGQTLRDALFDAGALPVTHALDVLRQVLAALAVAHEAGVVHRDVKPENVLLGDDGRVRVADFGLARAASATATSSVLMGTVGYLAPELVMTGTADARADVYAAGIVLFELLTGRLPFTGDVPAQVAFRHVQEDVPAPSTVQPHVPAAVDALVRRATARDPQLRPADAGELLDELRGVRTRLLAKALDGYPAAAAPEPAQPVPAPRRREHVLQLPVGEALEATALMPAVADDDPPQGGATVAVPLPSPTADVEGPATRRALRAATSAVPTVPHRSGPATDSADHTDPADPAHSAGPVRGASAAGRTAAAAGRARESLREAASSAQRAAGRLRPRLAGAAGTARRLPRRTAVLAALVVVLAVVSWTLTAGPLGRVDVPAVEDVAAERAVAALEAADLQPRTEEGHFDDVPAGQVVTTDPVAGESVRRGSAVTVVVSLGPEVFAVPDVTDGDLAAAEEAVSAAGLVVGEVREEWSETEAAGAVLSQQTEAGQELPRGSAVDLTVSGGREPIAVPAVVGASAKAARKAVEKAGLVVGDVREEPSATAPKGAVASQSPADGDLFRGDAVDLVVSTGPAVVTVPGVVGQPVDAAVATLEAAGLRVEVERFFGAPVGQVRVQDLAPGSQAEAGSTVTLAVV